MAEFREMVYQVGSAPACYGRSWGFESRHLSKNAKMSDISKGVANTIMPAQKNKVRPSLDLTSRCKETGSPDEYFLTAYKIESVLYVNVPLVLKILWPVKPLV